MDSVPKTEGLSPTPMDFTEAQQQQTPDASQRFSDDDALSEAGKSSCSSHPFGSPNPSESDEHVFLDVDGKKHKRRRIAPEGSTPRPSFPMSERQQLALLKAIMAPDQSESPKSPGQLTPTARSRGKISRVHRRNNLGETPLHVAAKKGEYKQCSLLLDQGADVNCVDNAGWTPLHEACNHGWYKTARALIERGADVNATATVNDDRPLHDAVANANTKLVLLLLKHGADKEKANKEGKRPIDLCEDDGVRMILLSPIEEVKSPLSSPESVVSEQTERTFTPSMSPTLPLKATSNIDISETHSKIALDEPIEETPASVTAEVESTDPITEDSLVTSVSEIALGPPVAQIEPAVVEEEEEEATTDIQIERPPDVSDGAHVGVSVPSSSASLNVLQSSESVRPRSSVGRVMSRSPRSPAMVNNLRKQQILRQQKRRKHWQQQMVLAAKKRRSSVPDTPTSSKTPVADVYDFHASDSDDSQKGAASAPAAAPPVKRATAGQETRPKRGRPRKHPVSGTVLFGDTKVTQQLEQDLALNLQENLMHPKRRKALEHQQALAAAADLKEEIEEQDADLADDKSSSNGPGRKVPPLRIVFSRSASDEEASEKSAGALARKTTDEGSTASAPISEPKRGRGSESTQRMTRSQVRAKGIELDAGVGPSGKPETDGASNAAAYPPHKKKMARANRTILPVTSTQSTCHWSQTVAAANTESILTKNSYEAYRDMRTIIENKWIREQSNLPRAVENYVAPRNYQHFMLTKKSYLLHKTRDTEPKVTIPSELKSLPDALQSLYAKQQEERNQLVVRQQVERERLIVCCEKEVLRAHARHANQSQLPLSAVRVFRDAEIYNSLELDKPSLLSPNSASPSVSSVADLSAAVDDVVMRFSKRKTELINRQRIEVQSLQATQQMCWESQLKKAGLLPIGQSWKLNQEHVPAVQVVDNFNLLPQD